MTLKFQHLGDNDALTLTVFTDASLGNHPDGGTQGGTLITHVGDRGKFSPLCWQSKRMRRVVRSTLAGETLAMSDGIDSSVFLATPFSELNSGTTEINAPALACVSLTITHCTMPLNQQNRSQRKDCGWTLVGSRNSFTAVSVEGSTR